MCLRDIYRGSDCLSRETVDKDLFVSYYITEWLFLNREVMRPTYMPEILPHREKEISDLASVLVPALRGETPSNVFVYGKTGTGRPRS